MNPWLHGAVYGAGLLGFMMTVGALASWYERKFTAVMQNRLGPNVVGPFGVYQPIADAIKMLRKEEIIPRDADRPLYLLAPWIPTFLVLISAAAVPFGGYYAADGHWQSTWLVADLDLGVLWLLAVSGLMVFPIWMAGWSGNNKYALLAGMRMVAQGISYEIPMVLTALVPVIAVGSMSISDIVAYQAEHGWLIWKLPGIGLVAFVFFYLASLAESNRIPFDIPEAESELVGGVLVEYTGMRFGIVLLSEYLHTLVASIVASALFLGGGHMPFLSAMLPWWTAPIFMLLKVGALFFSIYWVRWSWVRYRADQLMELCWYWMVPISLAMVMATALMVTGGWL